MSESTYQLLARHPYPNRDIAHIADLHFGEADLRITRMRIMLSHFEMVVQGLRGIDVSEAVRGINIGPEHAEASIHLDKFASPPLHHDVKADEAVLRRVVAADPVLAPHVELVHWAATSEDMSNIAWAVMHRAAVYTVLIPKLDALTRSIAEIAHREAETAALALTHGQPATPTTYGKRFAVFAQALNAAKMRLIGAAARLEVKCSGPTGNNNAAMLVWPGYPAAAAAWIRGLGFEVEAIAHQCSSYSSIIELLDALAAVALAVASTAGNIHRYIEVGELQQSARGEFASASSVMPQKINPHALESAGAHMRSVVATTTWMKLELGQNPWERELHTHPPERCYGGLYATLLVGIANVAGTIRGIVCRPDVIAARLEAHPEVLSEAFNTVARAAGIPGEYAAMAAAMRGDAEGISAFLAKRAGSFPEPHASLLATIVAGDPYVGNAPEQARMAGVAGPSVIPVAVPPRRRPLVIMNLNQLLLDTHKFLIDHLVDLTVRDPEFDIRPSATEIMAVMRNRVPLHTAFEAWFGASHASLLAQYLSWCQKYPADAMPGAPRALARIARTHDIIICTGSGTSSARRRLVESGFPDVFADIVAKITPEMVAGRRITVVTCNPIRPTAVPVLDPIRLRRKVVVGLYTRAECLEAGFADEDIADNLTEISFSL